MFVALATLASAQTARAEGFRLGLDWEKLGPVLRGEGGILSPFEWVQTTPESARRIASSEVGRPQPVADPNWIPREARPLQAPESSVGGWNDPREKARATLLPQVTLVARDWGSSQMVLGRTLSVRDSVRLSRSRRMLVARVEFGEGTVSPFLEGGFGQWRVDTDLLPAMPRATELAFQAGVGLQARLGSNLGLSLACDQTILYRDGESGRGATGARMLSGFIGARGTF